MRREISSILSRLKYRGIGDETFHPEPPRVMKWKGRVVRRDERHMFTASSGTVSWEKVRRDDSPSCLDCAFDDLPVEIIIDCYVRGTCCTFYGKSGCIPVTRSMAHRAMVLAANYIRRQT